jgi:RNase P/RNase MRP subunit POP5
MKRYKFEITVQETLACNGFIFKRRPREEYIFSAILSEDEVDINEVRKIIVAGRRKKKGA